MIPAVQFEKDAFKKQEIREKAKLYLKRAEEISNFVSRPLPITKTDKTDIITQNLSLDNSSPNSPIINVSSLTCVSSLSNPQPLQTFKKQTIKKIDLRNFFLVNFYFKFLSFFFKFI